jgi:hypothetical protein
MDFWTYFAQNCAPKANCTDCLGRGEVTRVIIRTGQPALRQQEMCNCMVKQVMPAKKKHKELYLVEKKSGSERESDVLPAEVSQPTG